MPRAYRNRKREQFALRLREALSDIEAPYEEQVNPGQVKEIGSFYKLAGSAVTAEDTARVLRNMLALASGDKRKSTRGYEFTPDTRSQVNAMRLLEKIQAKALLIESGQLDPAKELREEMRRDGFKPPKPQESAEVRAARERNKALKENGNG